MDERSVPRIREECRRNVLATWLHRTKRDSLGNTVSTNIRQRTDPPESQLRVVNFPRQVAPPRCRALASSDSGKLWRRFSAAARRCAAARRPRPRHDDNQPRGNPMQTRLKLRAAVAGAIASLLLSAAAFATPI